jgi:hypothetical protein
MRCLAPRAPHPLMELGNPHCGARLRVRQLNPPHGGGHSFGCVEKKAVRPLSRLLVVGSRLGRQSDNAEPLARLSSRFSCVGRRAGVTCPGPGRAVTRRVVLYSRRCLLQGGLMGWPRACIEPGSCPVVLSAEDDTGARRARTAELSRVCGLRVTGRSTESCPPAETTRSVRRR